MLVLVTGFAVPTLAKDTKPSGFDLIRGGLYFTSYFQTGGNYSNSGVLLWSPTYHFNQKLSFAADLGGTYINTSSQKFVALQYAGRLGWAFSKHISADITTGAQNWTQQSGTIWMGGAGFSYKFKKPVWSFIEGLRVSGQFVNRSAKPTWQLLAGFEVRLGGKK